MSTDERNSGRSGPVIDFFRLIKIQGVTPQELEDRPPESWQEVRWRKRRGDRDVGPYR